MKEKGQDGSHHNVDTGQHYDAESKVFTDSDGTKIEGVSMEDALNMIEAERAARSEMGECNAECLADIEAEEKENPMVDVDVVNGKFEMNGREYNLQLSPGIEVDVIYFEGDKTGLVTFKYELFDGFTVEGYAHIDEKGRVEINTESEAEHDEGEMSEEERKFADAEVAIWTYFNPIVKGNVIFVEKANFDITKMEAFHVKYGKETKSYKIEGLPKGAKAEYTQSLVDGEYDGGWISIGYKDPEYGELNGTIYIDEKGKFEASETEYEEDGTETYDDSEDHDLWLFYKPVFENDVIRLEKISE